MIYTNLNMHQDWQQLKKVGEVGPMNWQEGVMGYIVGWKRFTNSTWEKSHQGYRTQIEHRLQQLRIKLQLPKKFNKFLAHMLITLLISLTIFIAGMFFDADAVKLAATGQFIIWSVVYCIWTIAVIVSLRRQIRRGFSEIQAAVPGLKLQFSQLCECCCDCPRMDYITVYEKI